MNEYNFKSCELKRLIKESVKNYILEHNFNDSDNDLKKLATDKLQVAHQALNNLLMSLWMSSEQSEFARDLFEKVKQADDMILTARKNF